MRCGPKSIISTGRGDALYNGPIIRPHVTLTRRPSSTTLPAMNGLNLICGICREIIR
jgi:hypothetical protein